MSGFEAQLGGGDRRSIGQAEAVAAAVRAEPARVAELWSCLRSTDPLVRMRAADALEKISRDDSAPFVQWKHELLTGAVGDGTAEVCWNLLAIVPRLPLTEEEAQAFVTKLAGHLYDDPSRIVRTASLEALVNLSVDHPGLQPEATRLLTASLDDPTPSLRARARKLLARPDVRAALPDCSSNQAKARRR